MYSIYAVLSAGSRSDGDGDGEVVPGVPGVKVEEEEGEKSEELMLQQSTCTSDEEVKILEGER